MHIHTYVKNGLYELAKRSNNVDVELDGETMDVINEEMKSSSFTTKICRSVRRMLSPSTSWCLPIREQLSAPILNDKSLSMLLLNRKKENVHKEFNEDENLSMLLLNRNKEPENLDSILKQLAANNPLLSHLENNHPIPFNDIPTNLIENNPIPTKKVLSLVYRFLPQYWENTKMNYDCEITDSYMEILELMGQSFSSHFTKTLSHSVTTWLGFNSGSLGLLSCIMTTNPNVADTLFESVTYYDGNYTRLLILASLRIGCTIWYRTAPGNPDIRPDLSIFPNVPNYNLFHQRGYNPPDYIKYSIIEINNVRRLILSFLKLFDDISIPGDDGRPLFKSVDLCLMISILHAVGILPP